ncbi:MAG: hypothetical protein KA712_17145 [Myxococcales bacterium]|nr:hypothetical protein [Myxococcales bacterium]
MQVSWGGPTERHLRALERFYERHPHARNEIFVDAASAAHFASTVEGLLTA